MIQKFKKGNNKDNLNSQLKKYNNDPKTSLKMWLYLTVKFYQQMRHLKANLNIKVKPKKSTRNKNILNVTNLSKACICTYPLL